MPSLSVARDSPADGRGWPAAARTGSESGPSRNTGHSFWVYWAPFFLAAGALVLGIPVYLGQRRHMAQPASVPPYR
jgi:hypothetical protein